MGRKNLKLVAKNDVDLVDEQTEIAGMTNEDTARDQRMFGLDGDQAAEPTPEHKYWPNSQRTTGGEENDAKPTNGIPVEDPNSLPIRIGRQIGEQ